MFLEKNSLRYDLAFTLMQNMYACEDVFCKNKLKFTLEKYF